MATALLSLLPNDAVKQPVTLLEERIESRRGAATIDPRWPNALSKMHGTKFTP